MTEYAKVTSLYADHELPRLRAGAARQAGEIFDSDFILGHPVKEKEILQWKLRYKSSTSTSRELSSSIFHCDSVGLSLVREVLPSTNNWCPLLT